MFLLAHFHIFSFYLQNLVCTASDVLEGRGLVQVAVTVTELVRFHSPRSSVNQIPTVV